MGQNLFKRRKSIMDTVRMGIEISKAIAKLKTDLGLLDRRRGNSRTEKNISNRNYIENTSAVVGWLQFQHFFLKKEPGSSTR